MKTRHCYRVVLLAMIGLAVTGCKYQDMNRKPFQAPAGTLAAVYLDEKGNIVGADSVKHGVFERCALPGSKATVPVCRGLSNEGAVQSINNVTVIRSKINSYCMTYYTATGFPYQLCVDGDF